MKHRGKRPRIYRKKTQAVAQIQTIDQSSDLPGYPYYPHSEDITAVERREKLDVEQFPERVPPTKALESSQLQSEIVATGAETPQKGSDLTKDDMAALGAKDADMDEGDDEIMTLNGEHYDHTGEDLDIPGAELDDKNEEIGTEDEENNYYSLGGDAHDK